MKTKGWALAVMMVLLIAVTAWAGSEGPPNVYYGSGAGASNTTGTEDTFIGVNAGLSNTTGSGNSFIGASAGASNTEGSENGFIGDWAGASNTTGSSNSFMGYAAGYSNTSGNLNSFLGIFAGHFNTTGSSNSFMGNSAGYLNTTGNYNSFIGTAAGYSNTEGYNNSFLGDHAGASNTTGSRNVFLGNSAGYSETGSDKLYIDNCYIGAGCTQPLIYGEFDNRIVNIDGTVTATGFVGDGSGLTGVTMTETDPKVGALTNGKWCTSNGATVNCAADAPVTAETDPKVGTLTNGKWCTSNGATVNCTADSPGVGYQGPSNTYFGENAGASTTGSDDTFVGASAGQANTTGSWNTFLGTRSGESNTTGNSNTFVGLGAGSHNSTGHENTFLGYAAGHLNIDGYTNTFIGLSAGYSNTSGGENTFIGREAGLSNTTGGANTFIGNQAGRLNNGNANVFIGYYAGANETGSNKLYIDTFGSTTPLIYGEFDNRVMTVNGKLGVGTPTPDQFIHVKNDANVITSLRVENGNIFGASAPLAQEQFVLGPNGGEHMMLQVLSDSHATMPRVSLINAYTHDFYLRTNAVNVFKVIRTGAIQNTMVLSNGYVGIGTATPAYPLHMASGARVTTGGVWTNASSREYKENIQELSASEAEDTLAKLDPVKYNYKVDAEDRHVGFIAEDVPELVATKDRKGLSSMDIVAVLTKVVQEQKKTVEEQKQILEEKSQIINKQQQSIDDLASAVSQLKAEVNRLKNKDLTARIDIQ